MQIYLQGQTYWYYGKMIMIFYGDGTSHQEVLSPRVEPLREGVYTYTPNVTIPFEELRSVSLDWKSKLPCILCTIKIYRITIIPIYNPTVSRSLCGDPKPTPVRARKPVKFEKNC